MAVLTCFSVTHSQVRGHRVDCDTMPSLGSDKVIIGFLLPGKDKAVCRVSEEEELKGE